MKEKSKEIVLIAPYNDLYEKAVTILQRQEYANIEVVLANLDEGLSAARQKMGQGAKVIISRGGTFLLLRDVLRIPMVEIVITGYDLLASYPELMKLTEPLAIIGYKNIISGFDLVMGVGKNVKKIEISHDNDVDELITSCVNEGIRVFAGGAIVGEVCKRRGLRCFMWVSSETSILAAFDAALHILSSSKREIELLNRYLTLIDYVHDGIIATDEKHQIIMMNTPAQEIFKVSREKLLGKNIAELISYGSVMQEIASNEHIIEEIRQINDIKVSLTNIPIKVNDEVKGTVAVFQEVTRLQSLEQKIRMQLIDKGFVARNSFSDIIFKSKRMADCIAIAKKFSQYTSSVLIEGATGVGKELFAQSLHNEGRRKAGPFIAVNCAALPSSLLESELFGYEEGAFTGSKKGGKPGVFEMAHRGTLFLDEISEIPLIMQGRLLRVIQEKEVVRLGGNQVVSLDVRLICAANRNLKELVDEGKFRRDLFFRINTLQFYIPTLNERSEDILLIAKMFLDRFSQQYAKNIIGFTADAEKFLFDFHYTGNVRELRGMIERAVILCDNSVISADDVHFGLPTEPIIQETTISPNPQTLQINRSLEEIENCYVRQIFDQCGKSTVKACKILGIGRTTLWRKLNHNS